MHQTARVQISTPHGITNVIRYNLSTRATLVISLPEHLFYIVFVFTLSIGYVRAQ